MASLAASIAIHAFVLSLRIDPPAGTSGRVEAAPTSPDFPAAIRISEIVVAEPPAQLEAPETGTEDPVAELTELKPEDPLLTTEPESEDPSPTLEPELPRAADTDPAAKLGGGVSNPLLWLDLPAVAADSELPGVAPLSRRADRGVSGKTPADAWAFSTWTTRDAEGRLWGAAPGTIYLAGFAISMCSGDFDASDCGFGLHPSRREDYQRFLRAWKEIEQQKILGCITERAQAMRERREGKGDTIPPKVCAGFKGH